MKGLGLRGFGVQGFGLAVHEAPQQTLNRAEAGTICVQSDSIEGTFEESRQG